MSLLPPEVEVEVFYAAFGFWLVFTFVFERMLRGGGTHAAARTREDRGSAVAIFLTTFAAVVVGFALAGANVTPLPEWTLFVGIPFMFLGMLLRGWAVRTLKGFFLFTVGVREDQQVVEAGPYRLVRHPAYAGAILTFVGIGLAIQSLAAALLLLLLSCLVYWYRIKVEEAALARDLGEPYVEYMSRTKRLIPHVF